MKRQGQTGRCIDSGGYLVSFLQRANAEAAIMTLHPSLTCLSAQSFRPAIALLLKTGVVIWCSVPPQIVSDWRSLNRCHRSDGARSGWPSGAGSLGGQGRSPMWLLSERTDYERGCVAESHS